jgi:murein DD-endopeptidase MepM/ murein hydrolase activator NlpD
MSFEDLVEGLEGKRHRLASTPSIWPTEGWVTSGYGYRISPFTGRRNFHAGLDIASNFGTPILAPARGRVVFAGRKGPLGKTLVIDHGFGLRTSYGHTAELLVKKGEEVERGQRIAAVGSTGRSTGPHVHYSVEVKDRSVNPLNYIFE